MAIRKLPSGNYQARLQGPDGKVVSAVFYTRLEAQQQVLVWRKLKRERAKEIVSPESLTLNQYFEEWFRDVGSETAKEYRSGWRVRQHQYYRDYIGPVIGAFKLTEITPAHVKRVLVSMAGKGRSPQTQRLIYSTMKKMLGDAVDTYQYLIFNPVVRKIKPATHITEARHLSFEQSQRLLAHVKTRKYGLAIWLQLYLGLRVGELIALKWEDINFETGRLTIRRSFVRKTGQFREYPKGGRHHSHSIPEELFERLKDVFESRNSGWVVTSAGRKVNLPYRWYLHALKRYCLELGLPILGTHGLRHSTSELYMHHGATRDDLRNLFAHSSVQVTDRYVHNRGSNLEKVAKVIRLFDRDDQKATTKIDHAEVIHRNDDCK